MQQCTTGRQKARITRGQVCEYEQFFKLLSATVREWHKEGPNVQEEIIFIPSRALVFKVGLFDAPAEGQQVAVALVPLRQLSAGQSGGQDGAEVTEHQHIPFCRPQTHRHTVYSCFNQPVNKRSTHLPSQTENLSVQTAPLPVKKKICFFYLLLSLIVVF